MVTIFFVFLFLALFIPLGIAVQRWLYKNADEGCNPELELYQQRYD